MRISKSSRSYPRLNDGDWLRHVYDVERKTMKEIADLAGGCSAALVLHALRRFGIAGRKGKDALMDRGRKPSFPELYDKEWLAARRTEGMSASAIASFLGCSFGIVCRSMRKFGFHSRDDDIEDVTKSSNYGRSELLKDEEWLTEQYLINHRKAKHIAAELCVGVYAVTTALSRFKITKFPDRPQEKADPHMPAGVRRRGGYLRVYMPNHPSAKGKGYISQHRLFVEASIGRFLTETEQVHHINEKRDDNRLDNLILMPNYSSHVNLHCNPPPWIPRCHCCGKPQPELVAGRPSWVPLVYDPVRTYWPGPGGKPVQAEIENDLGSGI